MTKNTILKREAGKVWLELTQGCVAVVDEEDLPLVGAFRWCAYHVGRKTKRTYARTKLAKGVLVDLHRVITMADRGELIDHADGDGLNNSKSNLRRATASQNCHNKPVSPHKKSSRFKGVFRDRRGWKVQIRSKDGKLERAGITDEVDAATIYNFHAAALHGPFARLNTVPQPWPDALPQVLELTPPDASGKNVR